MKPMTDRPWSLSDADWDAVQEDVARLSSENRRRFGLGVGAVAVLVALIGAGWLSGVAEPRFVHGDASSGSADPARQSLRMETWMVNGGLLDEHVRSVSTERPGLEVTAWAFDPHPVPRGAHVTLTLDLRVTDCTAAVHAARSASEEADARPVFVVTADRWWGTTSTALDLPAGEAMLGDLVLMACGVDPSGAEPAS